LNIKFPKHIVVDDIEKMVNPKRSNVSLPNSKEMIKRANKWLDRSFAIKFSKLTIEDQKLLDSVKSIRNFLAHRSESSLDGMNKQLGNIETTLPANAGLGKGTANEIRSAGKYLRTKTSSGKRRVEIYLERLRQISDKLRP
jgi:hypothetical protein